MRHPVGTGEIEELFLDNDVDPDTVHSMASFSSRTLISDWDTLVTIEDTLSNVDYPIHILDDNAPYNSLTLHVQLNVDTNELVTQY